MEDIVTEIIKIIKDSNIVIEWNMNYLLLLRSRIWYSKIKQ